MAKEVGGFGFGDVHGAGSSLGGNLGEQVTASHSGGGMGGQPDANTGTGVVKPVHPVSTKYGKPEIGGEEPAPKPEHATGGVISQDDVDESERSEQAGERTHASAIAYNHQIDNEDEINGQGRRFGTEKGPKDQAMIDLNDKNKTQMANPQSR